jgi:simple sugar transport system permease protein
VLLSLDLAVWAAGESPSRVLALALAGSFGSTYGIAQTLAKATPLVWTGASVAFALRAKLFNVGAEGQIAVASLVSAVVGAGLPQGTPRPVAWLVVVAAAMLAGALWAMPPALLKARRGVHEVLSTVLMNKVADALLSMALASGLALAGTTRTQDVVPAARIPRLDVLSDAFRGSSASLSVGLAVAVAFIAAFAFRRTRVRELWLVGENPSAARAAGLPVGSRVAQAMLLSGALAGLASSATVLGYKGYFELGLGAGAGFGGLAVAMIGRGSAGGLVGAALFFGVLEQGGLVVNAHVPRDVMSVLEGLAIVLVVLGERLMVRGRSMEGAR